MNSFGFVVNNFLNHIASEEVQTFVFNNEGVDTSRMVLNNPSILGIPSGLIANQIDGRRRAKKKYPSIYGIRRIIYPPNLRLEQSSSEQTADFKTIKMTELMPEAQLVWDLTGGFGIDSWAFSRRFQSVVYVEKDRELTEIAKHNHGVLRALNIKHITATAEDFLAGNSEKADIIFIDPSRRVEGNNKVVRFNECEPDVLEMQDELLKRSGLLVIKASPLIDIAESLRILKQVACVHIISVENDCKEVLFFCRPDLSREVTIESTNIEKNGNLQQFSFTPTDERAALPVFSLPLEYVYEPNVALLKSGGFKSVAIAFGLKKWHTNTHLYTSDLLIESFPGRIFRVLKRVSRNDNLDELFPLRKANVLIRNYPSTVDELKKRFRLKDGGEKYLIGGTSAEDKILLCCDRIK